MKVLLLAVGLGLVALAQAQGPMVEKGKVQIIKMGLYPPDLIMRHQQQLGITDEQRSTITEAVKVFQSEVAELQWNMQNGQQELQQAFRNYPVGSEEALAKAEGVLQMESDFKLAHFRLLIAIKNALTQEQVATIDGLIEEKRGELRKREFNPG
jgi:Spy/CpxP family protein refolding chaperone